MGSMSENDPNTLVKDGYRLCFVCDPRDLNLGRQLLEEAAAMGRDDASLLLGKSFQLEGNYERAAYFYTMGFQSRYRASAYRLAILHGRNLLKDSDRNFFLRTIQILAGRGHYPSIARYTVERMKGSYGFLQIAVGIIVFVPNFFRHGMMLFRDPNHPSLEE
jgi:hypothetical protein